MPEQPQPSAPRRRLGILSYSHAEFDARSLRVARSALAAGYQVTIYARWAPGLALEEWRDGYRIVRVDSTWRLAVPMLRARARRAWPDCIAAGVPTPGSPAVVAGGSPPPDPTRRAARSRPRFGLRAIVRVIASPVRRVRSRLRHWRSLLYTFPLRPLGWAAALDEIAEPADVWHGMWAGSLPALVRLRRRHGGVAVYDSRDVYLLSREFYRLQWPIRSLLAALERRWARQTDRVVTVNEACADLLVRQLGVDRPAVVLNTPERWSPPAGGSQRIRGAIGLDPATRVVLYQGQLNTDRGIEQAAEAVLLLPDTALVLLGYGPRVDRYRELVRTPPHAGRVFLLPAVPPWDLLSWTASADVMVMAIQPTSTNHEFATPQKLWEALAAGVPVVASDLPGMAEVVHETGAGTLCDPTSPGSIAAGLRRVLDASPQERAAMRERARLAANGRYNWEAQGAILVGEYARLLARRAAADRHAG